MQLPPAITVEAQVFVWEKSPGFVPVNVMPDMVRVPVPVFSRVMFPVGLVCPTKIEPKDRLVGLKFTFGTPVPVPVRFTI